jgi:hypothetical protein
MIDDPGVGRADQVGAYTGHGVQYAQQVVHPLRVGEMDVPVDDREVGELGKVHVGLLKLEGLGIGELGIGELHTTNCSSIS